MGGAPWRSPRSALRSRVPGGSAHPLVLRPVSNFLSGLDFRPVPVCKFHALAPDRDRMGRELRSIVDTPGTLSPIDIFTGRLAVAGQPLTARRIGAFALDFLIPAPALLLLLALAATWVPESAKARLESAFGPVLLVYFVLTNTLVDVTPGQRILAQWVTRLDRSEPSGWQMFLRPIASVLTLGIGFLRATSAPRHPGRPGHPHANPGAAARHGRAGLWCSASHTPVTKPDSCHC